MHFLTKFYDSFGTCKDSSSFFVKLHSTNTSEFINFIHRGLFCIRLVGEFRLPHARTGGVLIVAHRRVKHTDTIFYVVRQNRLHPRERVHFIRDRERIYMEEEDHFTQTLLPALIAALAAAAMAARLLPLQLSLSLHSLAHTHVFSLQPSHKTCLFYRQFLTTFSSNSKGTIGPEIMPLIVALVMLPLSHN